MGPKSRTMREVNRRGIPPSDKTEIEGWKARNSLTLFIDNIPGHWMIAELKSFLDGFGNVVKVEIFEDREASNSLSSFSNDA
jgi:hypothetical protein